MIAKFLQILGLQPRISLERFFITVGQNNFGNKIPFLAQLLGIFLGEHKLLTTAQLISQD